MSPPRIPTVEDSFFVGIYSIYISMEFDESTLLLSIMAMASHGRQVFHFFRVVCVGKELEEEFSDNSDLSKTVISVFSLAIIPTYENLL